MKLLMPHESRKPMFYKITLKSEDFFQVYKAAVDYQQCFPPGNLFTIFILDQYITTTSYTLCHRPSMRFDDSYLILFCLLSSAFM